MNLRLPVDEALFEELRADFLPKASRHPGFRGFQYVLGRRGHAVGILWYEEPTDLDGITEMVGGWFRDHISPRLAQPETAMRGRVVIDAGEAWQHRRKGQTYPKHRCWRDGADSAWEPRSHDVEVLPELLPDGQD